ncbi:MULTISPECIES: hypothetical protein [Enterococcus]|uniref:hypothetical protein n=1 Tax=Enterococcus TaxID=1350 RepID=UPI000F7CFADE|nr:MULTISPECIES: hypothetical protein [Enterococcus]AZP91663.1 hypothetical protein CYK55_00340 [Enterococcus mundtii]QCJ57899.1 hypothetical protein DDJ96_15005 [Enterococcus mundtii]QCJ57905.1 hypothetical protein DDJ96_15050 [Enterococcus mundtii]
MDKKFVEQIKGDLDQLGISEDRSEELINDEALKLFTLFENKYEDVSDDSVDICLYRDGIIEISNEALPFSPQSMEERVYLTNLFSDSNFTVTSTSNRFIHVTSKMRKIEDLQELIQEYRSLRTQYLNKYGATTYYETVLEDGSIGWKRKRVPLQKKESSID